MSSQPSSLGGAFGEPSLFHPGRPGPELLESAAGTLRMLAEPTRLHLLWELAQGPKSVTELVDSASVPRTVISQHLSKLRLSGLVDTRKDGRRVIYSLHDGHLSRLIQETINHADHQVTGEPAHG
ncbi:MULTISPECIES: helix-turn-helix transcriptional regulator [Paenarthrobacter]|uniref:Metalloregulator ArsR/SmtB family transcription factor n=1 Tax=Paenarthrobacter ureafaciens TaxID=37931 RepID=A0AAX3EIS5_PAEUR|nr:MULTISPECIES: metalloregulator ArsR/SmtB family transcription factor [Paenarthrobacter]NKR13903.1 transcriptional regulator [Arthrobacter sp. M5]NKR17341.1 transcriptional regulator [Arthrobacter sp. M6]OEH58682.1 transcriptional regulator [Arthrobacter sp. D2]OEH61539.1 transcriptional regulator [Arthrobacter sp. D4]MDO5862991.1 metalloregulator ArsR/SmtB family transcription factor [Paenarthrobacter sp. SD-2]